MQEPRATREPDLSGVRCSSQTTGDRLTLSPEGALDMGGIPTMDAELDATLDGCRSVVVDLAGLTFMDSAGVHLMLRWATDAAHAGRSFRLMPGPARVQRVFHITGAGAALGLETA